MAFGSPFLFLIFVWFYCIPKLFGVPNGRQPLVKYFNDCGLPWLRKILNKKKIKMILIVVTSISTYFIVSNIIISQNINDLFTVDGYLVYILYMWMYIFFQEFFYRGLILSILSKHNSPKKAILIQSIIYIFVNSFVPYVFSSPFIPMVLYVHTSQLVHILIVEFAYTFLHGYLLGYASYKTKSILSGLISLFLISLFFTSPISMYVSFLYDFA